MVAVVKSLGGAASDFCYSPSYCSNQSFLYWRVAFLETYAEYIFDRAELLIVQEKTILCIFTEKGGK
jgi:hypothetical protein